jgi:phage tail tape-measure protein
VKLLSVSFTIVTSNVMESGDGVGAAVGTNVGDDVGAAVILVGAAVGSAVGRAVGLAVDVQLVSLVGSVTKPSLHKH